ncbi:MAG TPA: hypothetical protein VNK05_09130, partial [Chloroflexota bacterium]|nr:hypothetical protein [Chloroflexota bacterium]
RCSRSTAAAAAAEPALPAAAAAVLRLQRAYGNQAVQRLLPQAGSAGPGRGPQVQRWHDEEHNSSTKAGLAQSGQGEKLARVFGQHDGRYKKSEAVADRLGDASVNMDRFFPQVTAGPERESHNVGRLPTLLMFGGSIAMSTLGRGAEALLSSPQGPARGGRGTPTAKQKPYALGDPLPARGILGEGANHAEFGDYKLPEGASSAGNLAQEDHYIAEAIKALDTRPGVPGAAENAATDEALNRLGDAAHVSADRGSHGEGAKGKGHDTPYPPPGLDGHTRLPYFMEGWEDNDDKSLNPAGYAYGVAKTAAMFGRFAAAAGNRGRPPIPPFNPQHPRQNRPQQPLPGDGQGNAGGQ